VIPIATTLPHTYRVVAHSTRGGTGRADAGDASIAIDTSSASTGAEPGPAELVAAALAACILKNVERFSQILPFNYHTATVRVTAERRDNPPAFIRFDYELEIDTDEPDQRLDLLQRNLARYGTVYNTLAAAADVNGTVRRVR
jgi:uncharacterized OsmC-like protein